jgi:Tfp pilus assembly protein PilV
METYRSRLQTRSPLAPNRRQAAGFSLAEVLIAMVILIVGLTAMANLVAQSLAGTDSARYLGLATTLVSEKLEDLNRWPSGSPYVAAGGGLTADTAAGSLNYFDDVDLSNTSGRVSETVSKTDGTYSNVIHNATGYMDTSSTTSPPAGTGIIAFHRRWLIEANPVVNGVTLTGSRRITVVATLTNLAVKPTVSFQMSLVRP